MPITKSNSSNLSPKKLYNTIDHDEEITYEEKGLDQQIFELLKKSSLSVNQLTNSIPNNITVILETFLSIMELQGRIKMLPGGKIAVNCKGTK